MPYVQQPNGSWILVDEDGNRQGDGTVRVSTGQDRLDRDGINTETSWADDPGLTDQQRAALRSVGRGEADRAHKEATYIGQQSNGMDRGTGQQVSQMPDVNAIYNAVFGRDATPDEVNAWGPELQRLGLDKDAGAKAIFDAAYAAHGDTGNYTDWVAQQGWLPENPNQPVDRADDVNSIYGQLFGRDATQNEVDTWGNQINVNDWDSAEATRSIFDAAHSAHGDAGNYTDWVYDQGWVDRPVEEPPQPVDRSDDVNSIYSTLFGRDATQDEIDTWGNQINVNGWNTDTATRSVFDAAHSAHGDAGNYTDWVYDQGWVDRPTDMTYWNGSGGTGHQAGTIQRPNYGTPQQRPAFNFGGPQASQPMSIRAAQTNNMNNEAKSTEWQGRLQGLLDDNQYVQFQGLL